MLRRAADGDSQDDGAAVTFAEIAARILRNLENSRAAIAASDSHKSADGKGFCGTGPPSAAAGDTLYVGRQPRCDGVDARRAAAATARRRRPSRHLTLGQVRNLFDAEAFARARGSPMTRFVTIQMQHMPGRLIHNLSTITERIGKWLRYRGAGVAYLWTVERSSQFGLHVHMLIHVPKALRGGFDRELWKQVKRVLRERRLPRGTIQSKATWNVPGALKYMVKGCSRAAAQRFEIKRENGGMVPCKRCGVSESISRCRRVDWATKCDYEIMPTV